MQAELNSLKAETVDVKGQPQKEEVKYVRKSRKKKKEPKVVYYSSSSEDEVSPEIVYRKKTRLKKVKAQPIPPKVIPKPLNIRDVEKREDDEMIEAQYRQEVAKMRRDLIMNQVFPMG